MELVGFVGIGCGLRERKREVKDEAKDFGLSNGRLEMPLANMLKPHGAIRNSVLVLLSLARGARTVECGMGRSRFGRGLGAGTMGAGLHRVAVSVEMAELTLGVSMDWEEGGLRAKAWTKPRALGRAGRRRDPTKEMSTDGECDRKGTKTVTQRSGEENISGREGSVVAD